jgi:hypothetical protein
MPSIARVLHVLILVGVALASPIVGRANPIECTVNNVKYLLSDLQKMQAAGDYSKLSQTALNDALRDCCAANPPATDGNQFDVDKVQPIDAGSPKPSIHAPNDAFEDPTHSLDPNAPFTSGNGAGNDPVHVSSSSSASKPNSLMVLKAPVEIEGPLDIDGSRTTTSHSSDCGPESEEAHTDVDPGNNGNGNTGASPSTSHSITTEFGPEAGEAHTDVAPGNNANGNTGASPSISHSITSEFNGPQSGEAHTNTNVDPGNNGNAGASPTFHSIITEAGPQSGEAHTDLAAGNTVASPSISHPITNEFNGPQSGEAHTDVGTGNSPSVSHSITNDFNGPQSGEAHIDVDPNTGASPSISHSITSEFGSQSGEGHTDVDPGNNGSNRNSNLVEGIAGKPSCTCP